MNPAEVHAEVPDPLPEQVAPEETAQQQSGGGPPSQVATTAFSARLGMAVSLAERQPYLKTADPMPMLRPPDLVDSEEQGQVVALRPQGLLAVRFRRGTFLLPAAALRPC